MLRQTLSRVIVASAVSLPLIAGTALVAPALAQNTIRMSTSSGSGPGSGTEPEVTSKHVDRYADLLELTADQRAALKDMHQTFLNEQATAAALMQQAIDDARAEADESGQFEGFMKVVSSSRETYAKAAAEAKARLFEDLRLLLTPDQDQNWSSLERTRRRVENINRGILSSETVDLVQLVDDMEFAESVQESLTPVLNAYEVSIDTALADRAANQTALKEKLGDQQGGPMMFMQNDDSYKAIRDASVRVRDVNVTFARQLADTLPSELREKFTEEFQRRSFPQVYASTYAERVLDTALTFEDLSPDQKTQLEALRTRIEQEMDAANARWADAVRADEADPNTEVLVGEQFGMPMEIRMGEEPAALQEARQARSDLVTQYLDQTRALLSPEQKARLPKREPAQRGVGATGARMMVFETTTTGDSSGGDAPPPHGN